MKAPSRVLPRVLLSAALLATVTVGAPARGAPSVVASIKPVHSLVAGVMAGIGEPVLLVEGGGSPHSYSLRPSQALALAEADAVFWVGADMETFLDKPLRALTRRARVVTLARAPGIELLEARTGGAWQTHAHEHDQDDAHVQQAVESHPEGAHGEHDLHLWLDPRNAEAIVAVAVTVLSQIDPGNVQRYEQNGAEMLARLDALDTELAAKLQPVGDVPYVVFHDAYQYFERRYDLEAVGSVTVTPDRTPGAKRLYEIRRTIRERHAACVFSEPQFDPALVETVLQGTPARHGRLDPLGAELPAGPEAYFTLMRALGESLSSCLAPAADASNRSRE